MTQNPLGQPRESSTLSRDTIEEIANDFDSPRFLPAGGHDVWQLICIQFGNKNEVAVSHFGGRKFFNHKFMNEFSLFAQPWWVNLLILLPFVAYYLWRREGLVISKWTLIISGLFGIAFGFVEASVVVYLRAAVGLLPGYGGTLSDVARLSADIYQQAQILSELPKSLLAVEFFREAATIIMLLSIALVAVKSLRGRWAIFLWTFATWDIFYYVGLWTTVRWPSSLLTPDVLFLIPVPWLSQVWFPILISALTMVAVVIVRKDVKDSS